MKFNKEDKNNYIVAIGLLNRLSDYLDSQISPMKIALEKYSKERPNDSKRIEETRRYFELVKQDLILAEKVIKKSGINVAFLDAKTGDIY